MKFKRLFIFLTYTVAALGFLALLLTESGVGLTLTAMVLGLFGSHKRLRRFAPSDQMWKALTLLFVTLSAAQYFLLRVPILEVAQGLVVFLQVNRLYQRRTRRDYAQIFLLAFLQMLLGCILTVHPLFAFVLVAFMLTSAWGLMLLQLKSGMDEQNDPSGTERDPGSDERNAQDRYRAAAPLIGFPFLFASGLATVLMCVITLGLFLVTPRMEISLFQRQANRSVHVAGFSDQVRLGEVGQILQGTGRVMRVRVEARTGVMPDVPYWFGLALDEFDGQTWRLSRPLQELFRTRPMMLNRTSLPRGTNIIQRYSLEPLDSKVVFVMPQVLEIEAGLPSLVKNMTGSLSTLERQGRLDYTVYSRMINPTPEDLRQQSTRMPRRLQEIYHQLPALPDRIGALAQEISADQATDFDRATAIERFFHTKFTYTDSPDNRGPSPVDDFLFRTRNGHCEYFASAMVVMLRSVGIPARVANGFMGGQFNPVGQYYLVRQADAHSWVEVWFDRSSWVRFDPTPAGERPATQNQERTLSRRAMEYLDYLEMQWYYYILDYDLRAQVELFSELAGRGSALANQDLLENEDRGASSGRGGMVQILAVVVGVVALGALIRARRRSAARLYTNPALNSFRGRKFVARRKALHKELDRLGYPKHPGETPLERAARAGRELAAVSELTRVEAIYYGARFGDQPIGEADVDRVTYTLRRVKEKARSAGAAPPLQ